MRKLYISLSLVFVVLFCVSMSACTVRFDFFDDTTENTQATTTYVANTENTVSVEDETTIEEITDAYVPEDNTTIANNDVANQNNSQSVTNKKHNAELYNFTLKIDGKDVTIPVKVSDLASQLGFSLDEDDVTLTMEKDRYSFFSLTNGKKKVDIEAVNVKSDTPLTIPECDVFAITANRYDIYGYVEETSEPNISIILPGNVEVYKTTYQEVIDAYGEPDETSNDPDSKYIYLTWRLSENKFDYYTKMEITIEKETNLVYDFEYSKMPD